MDDDEEPKALLSDTRASGANVKRNKTQPSLPEATRLPTPAPFKDELDYEDIEQEPAPAVVELESGPRAVKRERPADSSADDVEITGFGIGPGTFNRTARTPHVQSLGTALLSQAERERKKAFFEIRQEEINLQRKNLKLEAKELEMRKEMLEML